MIEFENLFSFIELELNFIENVIEEKDGQFSPLKTCLMKNLKENLTLLAKENLDSMLKLKLNYEYKLSERDEKIYIDLNLFLNLILKLLKRIKRLYVRISGNTNNNEALAITLLKLLKSVLVSLKANLNFIDLLDMIVKYFNDFLIIVNLISFDEETTNVNNNAHRLDDHFKHSTPIRKDKKDKKKAYLKNYSSLCNKVFFVFFILTLFYFIIKYLNSLNANINGDDIDFNNLIGVTIPIGLIDRLKGFFKFADKQQDFFEDVVLVHKKANNIKNLDEIISSEEDGSELFWFTIFEYISNRYLILFSFLFYCVLQLTLKRHI